MRVVCVICTDHIEENFSATPCGHTFHFECLSQWLLQAKSCPQCREPCKPKNVIKLFITSNELSQNNDLQSMDPKDMREKLSLQEKLMTQKDNALEEARSLLDGIQNEMIAWQLQHKETHKRLKAEQSSTSVLKKQLTSVQHELDEVKGLRSETEKLRTRVSTLQVVEKMLKGSKEEIDMLVASHSSPGKLATVIVALKKDYDVLRGKRFSLLREKDKLSQEVSHTKKQLENKENKLRISQNQVLALESDLHLAEEEKRTIQKKVEMLQTAIDSPGSYHTLKRMLESPMPDLSTRKLLNVGASPLLTSVDSRHCLGVEDVDFVEEPEVLGMKRLYSNMKDNIVMPVPKMSKKRLPLQPKAFSSQVIKKDLKFAPRKKFVFSKK